MDALERTVLRHGINAAFGAFTAATVPELEASAAWTAGDPVKDLFDAIEIVQGAHEEVDESRVFDDDPNTLLVHPQALTKIIRNEQIQKLYIGDVAHDNPIYKGLTGYQLFGTLNVATSRLFMPKDEAYVFEQGAAGFKSMTPCPSTATSLYVEGGDSPIWWPHHVAALGSGPEACHRCGQPEVRGPYQGPVMRRVTLARAWNPGTGVLLRVPRLRLGTIWRSGWRRRALWLPRSCLSLPAPVVTRTAKPKPATEEKAAEVPSAPKRTASLDVWRESAKKKGIDPKGLTKKEIIAATCLLRKGGASHACDVR